GNSAGLIGLFAHNIAVTFALEMGILGFIATALYVWLLSKRSPSTSYILIIPVVINGFSLVSTSMPYFFVALGLLGASSAVPWERGGLFGDVDCEEGSGALCQ